jgi:phage terminase small subunit
MITPKQRRFAEEYLLDLNATRAAVRAGYRPDHARQMGAENLSKPVIADAIAAAQQARSERVQITQDDVLRFFADCTERQR